MAKYRESNMDKQREWNRRSYRNNAVSICEKTLAYHRANKDKVAMWAKTYRAKHPNQEKILYQKQYARDPLRFYMKNRRRYATKLNATPSWANPVYMKDMYTIAKIVSEATGIKHHVDHIVPLKSRSVCGLHVEHNLQVIPASQNCRKQNSNWPDMAA